MYFIPIGLLIKTDDAFLHSIGKNAAEYASLTWTNFFVVNLLPVTLGNVIGGVVLVGLVYWFIYLRSGLVSASTPARVGSTGPSSRTEARRHTR